MPVANGDFLSWPVLSVGSPLRFEQACYCILESSIMWWFQPGSPFSFGHSAWLDPSTLHTGAFQIMSTWRFCEQWVACSLEALTAKSWVWQFYDFYPSRESLATLTRFWFVKPVTSQDSHNYRARHLFIVIVLAGFKEVWRGGMWISSRSWER